MLGCDDGADDADGGKLSLGATDGSNEGKSLGETDGADGSPVGLIETVGIGAVGAEDGFTDTDGKGASVGLNEPVGIAVIGAEDGFTDTDGKGASVGLNEPVGIAVIGVDDGMPDTDGEGAVAAKKKGAEKFQSGKTGCCEGAVETNSSPCVTHALASKAASCSQRD